MQKRKGKEDKEAEVFYSQSLLSKNGPLGAIWLAAHFPRKLRKHLVVEIDVCASVDKILLAEVPMAFRLLGYLLIGVVRMYSRKVEYLYNDCNKALIRVKDPLTNARAPLTKEVPSSPFMSISLPQSFQLDAFDFGDLGDWEDDTPDKSIEQITREGMLTDEEDLSLSALKLTCSWEERVTHPEMLPRETCEEVLFPNIAKASLKKGDLNKLHDRDIMIETFRGHHGTFLDFGMFSSTTGSLDICQNFDNSPISMMDMSSLDIAKFSDPLICESDESKNLDPSNEILQGNVLPQENILNLSITCGSSWASNLQSMNIEASSEVLQGNPPPQEGPLNLYITCAASHSSKSQCPNDQKNQEEPIKVLEVVPLGLEKSTVPQVRSPVRTPKSDIRFPSVIATPEFMVIHTPMRREQTPMQQRRKRSFDETIVLPNQAMRQGLHDTSSLVHKRKKVPRTSQDIWRKHEASVLRHDFMEPLNPYIASELKALFTEEDFCPWSSIKLKSALSTDVECRSPVKSSLEKALSPKEILIEQMGPICLEVSEDCSEMIKEASIINQGEEKPATENPDVVLDLMNEEVSCEFYKNKDGWSGRTRTVAQYLHNRFIHNKVQNNGVISLVDILKGRSRAECARLFYETLVLKSERYVDVQQGSPYGEILLLTTKEIEAMV